MFVVVLDVFTLSLLFIGLAFGFGMRRWLLHRSLFGGKHPLGAFVVAVEVEVVISTARRTAQTVFVMLGLGMKAIAGIAGKTVPAQLAHAGKALQESAFLVKTIDHRLQLIPE